MVTFSIVTGVFSKIGPQALCFSIRTDLLDWDLRTFTSVVDTRLCEDDI